MKTTARPPSSQFDLDGPNFDGTFQDSILGRPARPSDWPCWKLAFKFLRTEVGMVHPVAYYPLRADHDVLPKRRILTSQGFGFQLCHQPRHGYDPTDPVDDEIDYDIDHADIRMGRGVSIGDGGYAKWVQKAILKGVPVYLVGYLELLPPEFVPLVKKRLVKCFDLEHDLHAHRTKLPNRPTAEEFLHMGLRDGLPRSARCDLILAKEAGTNPKTRCEAAAALPTTKPNEVEDLFLAANF